MKGWRVTYSKKGQGVIYKDITNIQEVIGVKKNPHFKFISIKEITVVFGEELSSVEIDEIIKEAQEKSDNQREFQRIEKAKLDKIKSEIKLLF